jgi:hypothetical protein
MEHALGVIASVSKRTGASKLDALAVGCFVAYEVSSKRSKSKKKKKKKASKQASKQNAEE